MILTLSVSAQKIKVYTADSVPLKHVLIANLVMDESVFTDKKGEADLTIFQDHDEMLQLVHHGYQTIIFPKDILVREGVIYMHQTSNKIAQVEVTINSKTKESCGSGSSPNPPG